MPIVELEYMIVDADSLDVRPVCDQVMAHFGGGFEVELEQRTGGFVDGIDGLEVWAGDVKAVSETRFTLSFGEGSATVSLRVGDTRAVLVDGRRFSVHFARQEDSVFGFSEDRAAIWITPRD